LVNQTEKPLISVPYSNSTKQSKFVCNQKRNNRRLDSNHKTTLSIKRAYFNPQLFQLSPCAQTRESPTIQAPQVSQILLDAKKTGFLGQSNVHVLSPRKGKEKGDVTYAIIF
jgi:hypothetical protein